MCVLPRCRRTSVAHAPSKPLLESGPLGRSDQSPRNHPPAAFLGSSSSALSDVRPCDPGCRRTTRPAVSGLRPADHLVHRSTVAQFSFFPVQVPAPEPARRRRAASRLPSRAPATLRSAVSLVHSSAPPSPPASHEPAPLLPARKSPTAGTREDDLHTSRPARAPEGPVRRFRARSAGSAFSPPRSCRTIHTPASPAPAGSHKSAPAHAPGFPRALLPTCVALLRSPDKRFPSAHTSALLSADVLATAGDSAVLLAATFPLFLVALRPFPPGSSPVLPDAAPAARFAFAAFPISAPATSAAASRSAASAARSHCRARRVVRLSKPAVAAVQRSVLLVRRDSVGSDQDGRARLS